jgi:protein NrfD
LSTYTGVLIGATAIPAWSRNVRLLPIHFGASSVGAAVSLLELIGHRDRALNALGIGAAAMETAIGLALESRTDPVMGALRNEWSWRVVRAGGLLSGPLPLAVRVLGGRSVTAGRLAAVSTIAGALLTRFGWVAAGRESTTNSQLPTPKSVNRQFNRRPSTPSHGDPGRSEDTPRAV